ncbi:unnamed protein product [Rhizophagus irregularis]|nr:unnamed protein product [Rhizophagus irregularis]
MQTTVPIFIKAASKSGLYISQEIKNIFHRCSIAVSFHKVGLIPHRCTSTEIYYNQLLYIVVPLSWQPNLIRRNNRRTS